jgi:hypothetical protein
MVPYLPNNNPLQANATAIIITAALVAMAWALLQFLVISRIPVRSEGVSDSTGLVSGTNDEATTRRLSEIYEAIYDGAESFLRAEYTICAWFVALFAIVIFVLVSWGTQWDFARGLFTALSFVLGACTSIRKLLLWGVSYPLFDCANGVLIYFITELVFV